MEGRAGPRQNRQKGENSAAFLPDGSARIGEKGQQKQGGDVRSKDAGLGPVRRRVIKTELTGGAARQGKRQETFAKKRKGGAWGGGVHSMLQTAGAQKRGKNVLLENTLFSKLTVP